MKKRLLSFILIFVLMAAGFNGGSVRADEEQFEVSLTYGYNGKLESGKTAPFEVSVKNKGDNFEGSVEILLFKSNSENVMFEKKLSLSSGQEKKVSLTVDTSGVSSKALLRILNAKGKVIYSKEAKLEFAKDAYTVNIGVLSDDFSALMYMAGKSFQSETSLITSLIELNADTLQSDAKALEMLDVILISDYSTDNLSDKQLEAIMTWVNNGGLLLVGTGSTAAKTLSKLNRGYIDVDTAALHKYNTKYGVSLLSFADFLSDYYMLSHEFGKEYVYMFEATSMQDYSKEVAAGDYQSFYYNFYAQNATLLKNLFWRSYFGDNYEWYVKNYDPDGLQQLEKEFANYCYDHILKNYYQDVVIEGMKADSSDIATDMAYINADVMDFSLAGAELEFKGEIEGSDETYKLAEAQRKGYGYVAVAGVDFTKNPFASYVPGNTTVVINLIESLIVGELYEEINEFENNRYYYYGYDYDITNLGEKLASLDAPPLLLYMVIILAYIVAGIILYVVLKKKKKSLLLWPAQAILALAMALVVFLTGFTTRITKPQIDVARINIIENGVCTENNVVAATIPGTESAEFSFLEEYNFEYLSESGYRYYYSSSSQVGDDYVIGYLDRPGTTGIELVNSMAMDTKYMQMTKIKDNVGNLEVNASYVGGVLTGTVTNNYGTKLENAYIYTGEYVFYIGDIKAGETIDLSTVKRQSFTRNWYNWSELSKMIFPDEKKASAAILMFGSGDKDFEKSYNKRAVANYCFNEYFESQIYNYTYSVSGSAGQAMAVVDKSTMGASSALAGQQNVVNKLGFMAFPVLEEEGTVQAEKRYAETVTEIVVTVVDNIIPIN